jgi:hypothetical protein
LARRDVKFSERLNRGKKKWRSAGQQTNGTMGIKKYLISETKKGSNSRIEGCKTLKF